ncbi:MAG TPA: lantibiotic dehydratase, partial [Kofleriaceae bacterium]|nr:lantibiotic dehydratase [Kofleriaceae bacterium]
EVLAALAARSQIVWTLEVAVGTPWPERDLRARLARVGDPGARAAMLAALAAVEQRRDAVAAAAGDPGAVARALDALDDDFVRATGAAPVRRGGETYAGRTLIYEDCVRELDVVVGDRWLAAVAPALSLLAHSARWYTHAVSTRYLALMRRLHDELRGAHGPSVPFPAFLAAYRPHGRAAPSLRATGCPPLIREIVDDLHARWAAILELPDAGRRVGRSAAELEARVLAQFAAPHGGAPLFRYHSPDVMIAAASAEAIARGEFLAVLGELHTGNNTISPVFLKEHLERDRLIQARAADLPHTDVYPVVPKEHQSRATLFTFKDHDVMLELGDAVRAWPRDRVLHPAELLVEDDGGRLVVRCTRTGRTSELWAVFAYFLLASSTDHYSIVGDRRHTPRVTIDRLVIVRETWRFEARELAWCRHKRPVERFAAMHRWMRAHQLPRFVFVKVPSEKKPFFTDLYSVELAEIFALEVGRAESVQLTEMLPGPDQVWLADPDGGRYVSELRLVLRDDRQGFGAPEGER